MKNDTQWVENLMQLRKIIDDNQSILKSMDRLRPPKTDREIMQAIGRRVGFTMTPTQPSNAEHELQYVLSKFNVSFDQFNKPPQETQEMIDNVEKSAQQREID